MAQTISFTVFGKPAQRGSKRAFPFKRKDGRLAVAVSDDNVRSKDWMHNVSSAAAEAFRGELLTGPVSLSVQFYFCRPKSHFRSGDNVGVLRALAPDRHTQKPDLCKSIRAIEDALTGVIWRDDSQICQYGVVWKAWTCEQARADVTVTELAP